MRAGNLDRVIVILDRRTALDLYGTVIDDWVVIASLRAQLINNSADDKETARGSVTDSTVKFRTRWLASLGLEHRVGYNGLDYRIRQIVEIGRRVAYDIVCERVGEGPVPDAVPPAQG